MVTGNQASVCDGTEALRCLSYPCRYSDMVLFFSFREQNTVCWFFDVSFFGKAGVICPTGKQHYNINSSLPGNVVGDITENGVEPFKSKVHEHLLSSV